MMNTCRQQQHPPGKEKTGSSTDEDSFKSKPKSEDIIKQEPLRKMRIIEKRKSTNTTNRKLWDYMVVPIRVEKVNEMRSELTEVQLSSILDESRRLQLILDQKERQQEKFILQARQTLRLVIQQNIKLKENSTRLQINHLELFDDISKKQQQLTTLQQEVKQERSNSVGLLVKKVQHSQLKARIDLQRTLSDKNKRLKRTFFYQSNCCFRASTPAWPLINNIYQPTELCYRNDRFQLYKALNIDTLEEVAIKLYYMKSDKDTKMIEHQYRLHSQLDHPNVLKCLDLFEFASDKLCIVYEWAENSLEEILSMLDEKTTLEVARMIGEGLKYLKCKQIVHRNLKISNLLVIDGIVKISNLSCAVDLATDTKDQALKVSDLPHLPPQYKYSQVSTERLDVWSLGVILYQCISKSMLASHDIGHIKKLTKELNCSEFMKRAMGQILTEDHLRSPIQAILVSLKK